MCNPSKHGSINDQKLLSDMQQTLRANLSKSDGLYNHPNLLKERQRKSLQTL